MGYQGTKEERYAKNRAAQVKYLSNPENLERHKARVKARNERYDAEVKAFIREVKDNKPCVDCGERFPHYVLDFDHVRGEKVNNISLMAGRRCSLTAIKAEIEKCELVCANCHRVRTFTRLGSVAQLGGAVL